MAIPAGARALLSALRFTGAGTEQLRHLAQDEWDQLLLFCDKSQLTLTVGALCGPSLPAAVRERIEKDAAKNAIKFARLTKDFLEIADALQMRGIDFAVLKGFAHSPLFTSDPLLRAQGDIDLWCGREQLHSANQALLELGYVPYCEAEDRHLPPLIKPSKWEWHGDFFDPELPIAVELHYQLWEDALERIEAPGLEDFWCRSVQQSFGDRAILTLDPVDALAFAALHQLMHVLRGDARMQRAWEIGAFLQSHEPDDEFWSRWQQLHPEKLRRLEAIVFQMAAEWFGCALSQYVKDEIERFPDGLKLWFARHALAPVENLFEPNKNELWLHLALVETFAGRVAVFRRRVFPVKRLHEYPANQAVGRWSDRMASWAWTGTRALYHVRVLPKTILGGIRWWWLCQGLGRPFLSFQLVSVFFDFGAFVFFVLYNLYLIDLGFGEQFIGLASSAMTAGTLAAALPAAAIARRIGTRNALLVAIVGGAIASALRVALVQQPMLLVTAFLNGAFFSFWAVCLSPAIASLTTEKNRDLAFSLIFSSGIGMGILAGVVAGYLPALFGVNPIRLGSLSAKRGALFLACGVILLGAPASLRLRFARTEAEEKKIYPRSSFVWSFLVALFVWTFATGIFNPFFNVYFARQGHLSVAQIGFVFAASHITQVGAILLAPLGFRWLGEVRGVAAMQFATAAALGLMAISPAGSLALLIYPLYMAFQYMSSPGVFSMLMGRVKPFERNGASALNFVVGSLAGMLASYAGGIAIARVGYPVTMAVAALLAALAALLFRFLIQETT